MEGLRVDKSGFPELRRLYDAGELNEEMLRTLIYSDLAVALQVDELLTDGEGELTVEDCNRIGTELPPGCYRHIGITNDEAKSKVFATVYMRAVDGVLDEMWLARARKGMPPNPLDVVPDSLTYIPSSVLPEGETWSRGGGQRNTADLPDVQGSQGVKGSRPTFYVRVIESPDWDHRWQFPYWKVRSSKLAPALMALREGGLKKVSLPVVRSVVERLGMDT